MVAVLCSVVLLCCGLVGARGHLAVDVDVNVAVCACLAFRELRCQARRFLCSGTEVQMIVLTPYMPFHCWSLQQSRSSAVESLRHWYLMTKLPAMYMGILNLPATMTWLFPIHPLQGQAILNLSSF